MNRIRIRRPVLVPLAIGVVAGAVTLISALEDPRRALVAWIAAYGFGIATVLAAMVLVMVLHVVGARWWLVLRPVFLATAGTAPIFVPLFVPIGAAFTLVYPWHAPPPDLSPHVEEALEHQRAWNNPTFFLARSAVYLACWMVLAVLLRRADAARTASPAPEHVRAERTLGAIGIPVLAFTMTFASFDWLMSLQPGWTSNMFGVYVFASGLVSALAVVAVGAWLFAKKGLLPEGVGPDHFHALGRLMLMAVIFWAYIGFFQLLLVWIANIPLEASFYVARSRGSWAGVDVALFVGRFVLPFFALLSRPLKRSARLLAAVGAWLTVTSVFDFAWLAIAATDARLSWAHLPPFVCVFALVWAYGARLAIGRAPAPEAAPEAAVDRPFEDALRYRSP